MNLDSANRSSMNTLAVDGQGDKAVKEHYDTGLYSGEAVVGTEVLDQWNAMSFEEKTKFEKKLVWKLDLRLVPWLSLLYLLSFLDRTNIGNAKLQGLTDDLHLTGAQYNMSLTIFFISYAFFEVPSNILLKRLRPHVWFTAIMVSWGIVMTFMGFVTNYSGLLAARWFLGFAEAGLFPGVQFYLSCWYKRKEFGLRSAIFFSAAALSGSFGGLLAVAIGEMSGAGGKAGWSWIFILEGLFTVVCGAISFWVVVDFPDDAKFLTPLEKHVVVARLKQDGQASHKYEQFKWKSFWASYRDWKTYSGMLMYMGVDGPLYAFSLFLPSIISELGYTATEAQLLTVPPYAVACLMTVLVGFAADRTGRRGVFNIIFALIGCAGFAILLASRNAHLSYAGTFLGAVAIYPCIPNTITWVGNNVEGVYKRGVVLGTVIAWGNLNGVMSSNVYRSQDAPWYTLGHAVILGYLAVGLLIGSCLNLVFLSIENKKRRNGTPEWRSSKLDGLSDEEQQSLADFHPDFKYTL